LTGNWTAIVINYNGEGFIEACMQALEACTLRPAEILVVDNASTDDSLLEMNAYPRAQVLAQATNLGFAAGANIGLAAVETDYAVILNPDVEVMSDFGDVLVSEFEADARLAAVGALLLYPDGETIQHAGGQLESPLMTTRHHLYGARLADTHLIAKDVDFVTGGAMGLRMSAVNESGGFDELLSPVYYEDVDLCVRLRALHWAVRFLPGLRALHHEGVTLQREPLYFHFLHRNRIQFAKKHLSEHGWSTSFVPAEIERLRWELQHLDHPDWLTVSGANAVESLLRSPQRWDAANRLDSTLFDQLRSGIDEVRESWQVTGVVRASGNPLARLLVRILHAIGLRQYMSAMLEEQRAFNAAVLRSFESQERLNREQMATMLLLAIDLTARLQEQDAVSRRTNDLPHPET
jgi:O-antigen biosynthesis protein